MKRFSDIQLFDTFTNSNYLFLHNNNYVSGNVTINSLKIDQDIEFTVYHLFDNDCDVEYIINPGINVKITEVNHYLGNVKVTKNIKCLDSSQCTLITIEKSIDSNNQICVNVNTIIEDNAYLNNMKLAIYKSDIKYSEESLLTGKKAKLESFNVIIDNCNKHQQFDLVSKHTGIETESQMTNYGICKGKSVLDINTNGYVTRGAAKSNISQKTKGILLDLDATISANPWLQIDDYDCLASHGAGIGAIDNEELYYLMSRGLTESESSRLIIDGFVNPVYEEINNQELKEKIISLNILN